MQYVVLDLEWNQPLSHLSSAFRKVGDRLMFELIQIGAVKLDEKRRLIGSFSRLIAPEHYMKLHPRIRRITGISQDELRDAPRFAEAFEQFADWCGEDYVLLTWGSDDISVLQQNIDFFRVTRPLAPMYDLQRLYSSLNDSNKEHKGLQAAMKAYEVAESDEHPFHNAVDDAYYTARVFQRFPEAEAVLNFPQKPRPIGKAKPRGRTKTSDLAIRSEQEYFLSPAAMRVPCPTCGKLSHVPEGYVPQRSKWVALADCADHGLIYVEVAFDREEGGLRARRSISLSDEQNKAYVATKHLQWANKLAQRKEAAG